VTRIDPGVVSLVAELRGAPEHDCLEGHRHNPCITPPASQTDIDLSAFWAESGSPKNQ
jgi:hypothetical protein